MLSDKIIKKELYISIFCLLLLIAVNHSIVIEEENTSVFTTNIFSLIFFSVLIAPLSEEIIMRGWFTKNKVFVVLSLVSLPIICIVKSTFFTISLTILWYTLLFINNKVKKINIRFFIIVNSLLFSFFHQTDNFGEYDFIRFLIHFFAGTSLAYIVLKYNIWKSVLAHFIYNLSLILIVFFSLLNISYETKVFETNTIKVVLSPEISVFKQKSVFIIGTDYVKGKNVTKQQITNKFNIRSTNYSDHPLLRYDFIIHRKDTSVDLRNEINNVLCLIENIETN